MIASNTSRGALGFRPPPLLRSFVCHRSCAAGALSQRSALLSGPTLGKRNLRRNGPSLNSSIALIRKKRSRPQPYESAKAMPTTEGGSNFFFGSDQQPEFGNFGMAVPAYLSASACCSISMNARVLVGISRRPGNTAHAVADGRHQSGNTR